MIRNHEVKDDQQLNLEELISKSIPVMDDEVVKLCRAMNGIKGIKTVCSCCGHGKEPFMIWFHVTDPKGLFFLARCVSDRYWQYGTNWRIEVSAGDSMTNGLPVVYLLTSLHEHGEEAYKQAEDLIENMKYHRNHEAFMEHYGLNKDDIKLEE